MEDNDFEQQELFETEKYISDLDRAWTRSTTGERA